MHLVSAAATPLGGDTIDIRVVVEAGARLNLRSAAAAVVLPGADSLTSHARWDIEVSGSLDIDLEPTIVAAAARHVSDVTLPCATTAAFGSASGYRSADAMSAKASGRVAKAPTGTIVRCCGTGWNWAPDRWPTTRSPHRAR